MPILKYTDMLKKTFILFIAIPILFLCGCSSHEPNTADAYNAEIKARLRLQEENNRNLENRQTPKISPKQVKNFTNERLLDEALELCEKSQEYRKRGETDDALEILDKAYSLVLKVEIPDNHKLEQQKEEIRYMISKRILELYASRNITVKGKHNAIQMTLNKYVKKEIELFTSSEREFFIASYKRSGKYRDMMLEKITQAGLPEDLSWLPLIESGFKVRALSHARALGLWQFIPSTGYKFGLKRNLYIDERLDPVKSTDAAIDYLKELHGIFGDWATALAAYNCGEGRILRQIKKHNLKYLDNFWDVYEQLPQETARYVPRFIAVLHILKKPSKYGFENTETLKPTDGFDTVSIKKRLKLSDIADQLNIPESVLEELNPELRYKILPGEKEYKLKIPLGKKRILLARLNRIPIASEPGPVYAYHRVGYGDTLSKLARKYRTNIRSIMRANNLRKKNYLSVGARLRIPKGKNRTGSRYSASVRKAKKKRYISRRVFHRVRSNETLWAIARRYKTTPKTIQRMNRLKSTQLRIGQMLKVPKKITYTVKEGDSPYMIATNHRMPLKRFLRINKFSTRTKIYPGQNVYVE